MPDARGLVVWEQEEEAEDGGVIGLQRCGAVNGMVGGLRERFSSFRGRLDTYSWKCPFLLHIFQLLCTSLKEVCYNSI
jgi:hypothetical protein